MTIARVDIATTTCDTLLNDVAQQSNIDHNIHPAATADTYSIYIRMNAFL